MGKSRKVMEKSRKSHGKVTERRHLRSYGLPLGRSYSESLMCFLCSQLYSGSCVLESYCVTVALFLGSSLRERGGNHCFGDRVNSSLCSRLSLSLHLQSTVGWSHLPFRPASCGCHPSPSLTIPVHPCPSLSSLTKNTKKHENPKKTRNFDEKNWKNNKKNHRYDNSTVSVSFN